MDLEKEFFGDKLKEEIGVRSNLIVSQGSLVRNLRNTYGPTDENHALLSRKKSMLKKFKAKLIPILNSTLPALENDLKKTGAPWIEGQGLIKN